MGFTRRARSDSPRWGQTPAALPGWQVISCVLSSRLYSQKQGIQGRCSLAYMVQPPRPRAKCPAESFSRGLFTAHTFTTSPWARSQCQQSSASSRASSCPRLPCWLLFPLAFSVNPKNTRKLKRTASVCLCGNKLRASAEKMSLAFDKAALEMSPCVLNRPQSRPETSALH